MYCRTCGKEVGQQAVVCVSCGCAPLAGNKFCPSCGAETNPSAVVCTKCGAGLTKVMAAASGQPKTPGLAIASLVCGLIICCWPLTGIAAVICGHLAMAKINRGEAGGKTIATVGLVLGYIGIALGILSIILQVTGVVESPWMHMQQ